jgi:hypothetical protein
MEEKPPAFANVVENSNLSIALKVLEIRALECSLNTSLAKNPCPK